MKRTIAVVTTSRADYSHLYWPLHDLARHPDVELRLIVMGSHLSPEFGSTVDEIERDGFAIADRVESPLTSDLPKGIAAAIGSGVSAFAESFDRERPDILLVLGDRYERTPRDSGPISWDSGMGRSWERSQPPGPAGVASTTERSSRRESR